MDIAIGCRKIAILLSKKDISGCLEPETRFISSQEQNRVINLEGQEMIN